jgi:4'-phosphopantetheinyl transferase
MSVQMNITEPGFSLAGPIALPENEVQLWRVDLGAVGPEESRWQQVLSEDERARAARFHFSRDRQRYVSSRALLRIILAAYLGAGPKEFSFRYSEKEKPALDGVYAKHELEFNISHSGMVALLAFTRGREVGVDVELIRQDFDVEGIAHRFFSEHEKQELAAFAPKERHEAFFRCWTRKEAYVKATGAGLSLPLSQFDVSLAVGDSDALISTRPDATEAGRWHMHEVSAGAGYAAAICVLGRGWHLRAWSEDHETTMRRGLFDVSSE